MFLATEILLRSLKSSFIFDLLAFFPIPQVYLGYQILMVRMFQASNLYYHITCILGVQFYIKLLALYLIYRNIEKFTGIAIRNPWSGTLYILFVYGTLSHFVGAIYYFLYVDELLLCRSLRFQEEQNAKTTALDQLMSRCSPNEGEHEGLLSDAFTNRIGSRTFSQKFMFCFSWGLKTLSSMGQNLQSSVLIVDTVFNFIIIIIGLLLFADLIARMQTCMQSVGEQEEQQMVRQREVEEWMKFHELPLCLKKRVQETVQSQFCMNKGIDNETILESLPMELRCEIRRRLYLGLAHNLPVFEALDEHFLHAISGHLRTFSGAEGMFLFLEGEPVQQLLFLFSGQVEIFSINDGCSSCVTVGPGGVCGQELIAWSTLSSTSTHNLPFSTCTVKCLTDVEAFSLLAKDVKLLALQFNYDQNFFEALSCQPVNIDGLP